MVQQFCHGSHLHGPGQEHMIRVKDNFDQNARAKSSVKDSNDPTAIVKRLFT